MTMQNFLSASDLELLGRSPSPAPAPTPAPEVAVEVEVETTVHRRPNASRSYLLANEEAWGWEELRDYVVDQIERVSGPFPRNGAREKAIFSRFVNTWGNSSASIAKYAFEVCEGWWAGAPIQVQRFCKGSDKFFAAPIHEKIVAAQTAL